MAPAERLARLGVPVSRALSRDLQVGAVALGADSEARRMFGRGTGTAVTEGDNFVQTDLAATLGILRQRGGTDLSTGSLARVVSEQVAQIGGSMPTEALRSAVPQAGPPAGESYGGFRVYVAPPPMAGAMALAGWNGQAASERRRADRLGRHLGPGGDRLEGRRGRLQPVDGPAVRRARDGARTPASCSARRLPTARRSARW